jgi:GH25 family lysozyme M1 (1,4-beta-N-acetylmuramidase)
MLKGVDISKWQGAVNFDILKENTDFVIIRSSYGNGYIDECFVYNCKELRRLKIPRGFYHYAYPTYNSPEAEADWFSHVVGIIEKGEILFLDFEESYPDPVGWSLKFLDKLSANYGGYKPLVYLNRHITQTYDWKPVVDKGYGLWLAYWDYTINDSPKTPWEVVAFRQYSNQEQVKGINGRVDGNVFYGEITQFYKYGFSKLTDPLQEEIVRLRDELAKMTTWGEGWKIKAENRQTLIDQAQEDYKKLQDLAEERNQDNIKLREQALQDRRDLEIAQNSVDTLTLSKTALEGEIKRLKAKKYTVGEALNLLIIAIKGK